MRRVSCLLALALLSTSALAQEPEAPAAKEKKICKVENETRSRLASRRICLTAHQWKARKLDAERELGEQQRRANSK